MEVTCGICQGRLNGKILQHTGDDSRDYDIFWCDRCAVGTLHPLPEEADLARLYASGNYRSGKGRRFNRPVEFFVYLSRIMRKRRIKRFVERGSILDIGCGRGLFLDVMRKDGWTVAGSEVNEEVAREASEANGFSVVSGEPSGWRLPKGGLDVITLSHVLEHLRDPVMMLEHCRRLLRKGGVLVCATPNCASLQAAVGKGEWFHLDVPRHIHLFSEAGLLRLLRQHGFAVARIRRFDVEYDPFGWLQTLLNRSGIRRNYLYDLLKGPELRKRERAGNGRWDGILTFLLLPAYLPLAFVLALVESFVLKRGGSVEAVAIKE